MLVAQLSFKELPDRRAAPRSPISRPGRIVDGAGTPVEVTVRDLSADGFSIDADLDLPIGSVISLQTGGATLGDARIVRQVFAHYGCRFLTSRHSNDA